MTLTRGTCLGPYVIEAAVGAGGMGEVYRARDSRLDRTVAIKVLPEAVAADRLSRERFEREARAVSALNHPGICTLHDVGHEAGRDFLVMEFVDGEALDARIRRGPLPVEQALAIARQIADALDAAHERGIIHRDLKPANIKVTPDGAIKILDFGLAKALSPPGSEDDALSPGHDPANSPTVTALSPTQVGVILGTAAYMSPEQARGRRVDKRTDIWAFGCVLYEMLAGRALFSGETVTDILAAILTRTPELEALPATTPPGIRRLLGRCLQREPKQRLRDIADARMEIDDAGATAPPEGVPAAMPALPRRSVTRRAAIAAIAVMASAGIFYAGSQYAGSRTEPPASNWEGITFSGPTIAFEPRISPNGELLAFQAMVNGTTQIGVMNPRATGFRILTTDRTRGSAGDLCWSADSTRIYFDRYNESPGGIFSVSVFGEDLRLVVANAWAPRLLKDGSLILARINASNQMQLFRFWPGSAPERIEPLNGLLSSRVLNPAVEVFPDGREVVFLGRPADAADAPEHIYVLDLSTGRTRAIAPNIPLDPGAWTFPLTVDAQRILFVLPAGDLRRVVSVPRDPGPQPAQTLLTLSQRPLYMHAGSDGAIYTDQIAQPSELIWYAPETKTVQARMPIGASSELSATIALPDGRVLVQFGGAGRRQLMAFAPGKALGPFMDTPEETSAPASMLGPDRIVLLLGSVPNRRVAIVRVADGRVESFVDGVDGNAVGSLAGAPDGRNLFWASRGTVWKMDLQQSGTPQQMHPGSQVAVDPNGQFVVIQVQERAETRLITMPLSGGQAKPVAVTGAYRVATGGLLSGAVGRNGQILTRVTSADSWYWPIGLSSPGGGPIAPIDLGPEMDVAGGWTADGRIVAHANVTLSTLWRFKQR